MWTYSTRTTLTWLFGREDAGLPEELLAAHEADCVRMPMRRGRATNLSNAVAVGAYEALRQWDLPTWRHGR